ncbi:MAG: helix-turn-helix transcriptional regulator [Dysgonomonas sp.]|uniref:S24 family peptidase n=1 Tax=Dysgonomonas sp. TaxID=1891233 RepID=UPI003A86017B
MQYLDYKGVSKYECYQNTGITNGVLSQKSGISEDNILKFLSYYSDINTEWLLTGNGSMLKEDISKKYDIQESTPVASEPQISLYKLRTDYYGVERQIIPLYEIEASAGLALLFSNQSQQIPIDHIVLPNAPKCDGAMYIRGDSMYPLLKAGDIACYKTIHNLDNVIIGEKYILDISNGDDDYLTVKYVQKSEKGDKYFKLVSENKYHADRNIHISTIRALAMVKATIRFETLA